jgi:hypothetical protein
MEFLNLISSELILILLQVYGKCLFHVKDQKIEIVTVPNVDLISDPRIISGVIVQPVIIEEVAVPSRICNAVVYQFEWNFFDEDIEW